MYIQYKYTIYNAAGGQIYTEDITESVWSIIQDQKLNKFAFKLKCFTLWQI